MRRHIVSKGLEQLQKVLGCYDIINMANMIGEYGQLAERLILDGPLQIHPLIAYNDFFRIGLLEAMVGSDLHF